MSRAFVGLTSIGAAGPDHVSAAHSAPVPLARELQHLIRAVPRPPTGADLIAFMGRARELGQGLVGPLHAWSRERTEALLALEGAIADPATAGISPATATYSPESRGYREAVRLATRFVATTSKDLGEAAVRAGAARQLRHDLTHPDLPGPPGGWPTAGLLAALFVGGYALASGGRRR